MKKLDTKTYRTDKGGNPDYLKVYEEILGPVADQDLKLLELGVMHGGSLLMWRDYLSNATIVGLDINQVDVDDSSGRVHFYRGEQQDTQMLDTLAAETAPEGFDVIIDDASHVGSYTRISFWHLFDHHLKPGGWFIIEDWSASYWKVVPDGRHYRPKPPRLALHERFLSWLSHLAFVENQSFLRKVLGRLRWDWVQRSFPSHSRGLVGFVKELVDECAMSVITDPELGVPPHRESRFEDFRIYRGQVVVRKAR